MGEPIGCGMEYMYIHILYDIVEDEAALLGHVHKDIHKYSAIQKLSVVHIYN